jgi:hypothetical protein
MYDLTMTDTALPWRTDRPFNRYTLTYSADVPLCGTLTYTVAGLPQAEDFFLEAGEGVRFSSYINSFLSGGLAEGTVSLALRTIAHEQGRFSLISLDTDVAEVPAAETYYLENQRYRVGIELCWGGGLSCLIDKKCPVEGLGNLLNRFDTGRLVQQSYYGTSEPPYICGEFMGNRWGYNPVQGGDRGNHKSKLIETRITEEEVYIKCRPRDWGHDGGTTYAYMENWYRLEGDVVAVKNRFVDFSGWSHPIRDQEVPAFYTVSYLNNYYWYDGSHPWSDDALSVRGDLPFWPTDWKACTFLPAEGNTEVWSAFADDNGYGLGLFTPNVHLTLAGRHEYDGSKDPDAASCGYIAPIRRLALKCFEPVEYGYLLAAGQVEDIRAQFKAHMEDALVQNGGFLTY